MVRALFEGILQGFRGNSQAQNAAGRNQPTHILGLPTHISDYEQELKANGKAPETVTNTITRLKRFAKQCDITNPYEVKEKLAELKWKNNTKNTMIIHFTQYFKFLGKQWTPPKYKNEETLPFIPTEQEIDQLIASMTRKYATYLQILKETGIRTSELMLLKWIDIDTQRKTVNITPTKGSNPRILPISDKLLAMLNQLEKKSEKIVWVTKKSLRSAYNRARARTAKKLSNPRLQKITLHTFRHWKGTMEYHKTKDFLHVKRILGHKAIECTLIYINIEQALFLQDTDEWICKVAHNEAEAIKLIEANFTYVNNLGDQCALYRKRK
jgi:integrase